MSSTTSWLRRRSLGKNRAQRAPTSHDLVRRLELEASFPMGFLSQSTPLEWNQRGDLLASFRHEEHQTYLCVAWDVFMQREKYAVRSGHTSEVNSFKFMPGSNDAKVITTSQDRTVRQLDLENESYSLVWEGDPCVGYSWINDLAVHPAEPNLIWSVSQDGYFSQHDLRQSQECSRYKFSDKWLQSMAINPMRSEMFAIGHAGGYTSLLDRRQLRIDGDTPCIAHFAHVYERFRHSYGTTDLAFNSNGSELLATVELGQIYLFNTYEPWQRYRSFDVSLKPLLTNGPELETCSPSRVKPYYYINELRKQRPVEMQDQLKGLCNDLLSKTGIFSSRISQPPNDIIDHINKSLRIRLRHASESTGGHFWNENSMKIVDYLNVLIGKVKNCPDLYRARATALAARDWYGDSYQALRDCCCALALKPLDFQTIRCLAAVLIKIGNEEDVRHLLDFVELTMKELGANDDLSRSREMLRGFKKRKIIDDYMHPALIFNRFIDSDCPPSLFHLDMDSRRCTNPFDYSRRYRYNFKGFSCETARFFGGNDEFVVGGCYNDAFYIWDKNTTNIVKIFHEEVNGRYVRPHPSICMLAAKGNYSRTLKLWSPGGGRKIFENQES